MNPTLSVPAHAYKKTALAGASFYEATEIFVPEAGIIIENGSVYFSQNPNNVRIGLNGYSYNTELCNVSIPRETVEKLVRYCELQKQLQTLFNEVVSPELNKLFTDDDCVMNNGQKVKITGRIVKPSQNLEFEESELEKIEEVAKDRLP